MSALPETPALIAYVSHTEQVPMSPLDPTDPENHLRWPREAVTNELRRRIVTNSAYFAELGANWSGVQRLLEQAFEGPTAAKLFAAQTFSPLDWAKSLLAQLPDLPLAQRAPLWSSRRGQTAARSVITRSDAMDRFVRLVAELDRQGLWAERFGVDCPDGVLDPLAQPSEEIADRLGYTLGDGPIWPLYTSRPSWSEDQFLDLIEVLHDLASWPGRWDSHSYGGCVGHPGDFSPSCGQDLYRHRVNDLLALTDLGLQLSADGPDRGRLIVVTDEASELTMARALSSTDTSDPDRVDVAHAIELYRSRGRDAPAMRSAIVTLAGVLESDRELLKRELLTKDEGALFQIANQFNLRHRNPGQSTDYNEELFLPWIFTWYLSTVNLLRELREQESGKGRAGSKAR